MIRLPKFINNTLSIRLNLMVVFAVAVLLLVSLTIILHVSRKAIKEEALQKAMQTVEGTVQRIDNILLSVEQASGNTYFNLLPNLNNQEKVKSYCQKLAEANRYIDGCAIAFTPYYYKDSEYFISYYYRTPEGLKYTNTPVIQPDFFGNCPYTEQVWFAKPITSGRAEWLDPTEGTESQKRSFASFCIPISSNDGKRIGVIGVDMSLKALSDIAQGAKPSQNSYCAILAEDGTYIVHPDSNKLHNKKALTEAKENADPSVRVAAEAMMAGETGYKPFRMNGKDYFVFYKPFTRSAVRGRSMEELNWSIGIVYPENDIFGDYNRLLYYVLGIAIVGILLLYVLLRIIIRHQLLPLTLLTRSAQRIADGEYDDIIPDSQQRDEIGSLQNHFQQMQRSLASNIEELETLKYTLQERGKELKVAYEKAQQADRMKTAFLHNMTDKMATPAKAIHKDVDALCNFSSKDMEEQKVSRLANDIQKQGDTIAELLNDMLHMSEKELKKGGEK